MVDTAIDITGTRASAGRDDVTGAGLIDANAAIGALQQGPNGTINTPSGNVRISSGESIHFSGTGTSPDGHVPLSFFWDFGGGAANASVAAPGNVVFRQSGTFTVTFTVSDHQGNSDATPATIQVAVSAPPASPTPPAPTPTPAPVAVSGGSSGGGGGCTLDPNGTADFTLLIALSGILAYGVWRRRAGQRVC
jgi:hypothetical protein